MANKKKISKLVKKFRKKFKQAEKNINQYRKEWDKLDKKVREVFDVLNNEHKKDEFYSNLFIQDEDFGVIDTEVENKSHIAIRFGLKPLDIREIEYDPQTGMPRKGNQELENGAALFFSQGAKGQVLVYLLPAKNDLIQKGDKILMLKTYSKPSKLKEKHIRKHLSQFFWYALVTSYLSDISFWDRYKIYFYKFRSNTLKIDWGLVLPALILLVSVVHLVLFVIYVIN